MEHSGPSASIHISDDFSRARGPSVPEQSPRGVCAPPSCPASITAGLVRFWVRLGPNPPIESAAGFVCGSRSTKLPARRPYSSPLTFDLVPPRPKSTERRQRTSWPKSSWKSRWIALPCPGDYPVTCIPELRSSGNWTFPTGLRRRQPNGHPLDREPGKRARLRAPRSWAGPLAREGVSWVGHRTFGKQIRRHRPDGS